MLENCFNDNDDANNNKKHGRGLNRRDELCIQLGESTN
jgi:hypothetical protein